jgi:hypothetical protein
MMNRLIQTFKANYKMKKIEFKDVSRATDEKNQVAQFCRILTENLRALRKFNKVTHLIDEANLFEVTTAERDSGSRGKLLRIVSTATPFGGINATDEKVDEILYVLTTTNMTERRGKYPRFGNIAPLRSIEPPIIDGRTCRGSDFVIKKDEALPTDALLDWIETNSLYSVENEAQEKVYNLSTAIARNFQELAMVYAKEGKVLDRNLFMRQLFMMGDVQDYRMDEKNLFVSILPLFK